MNKRDTFYEYAKMLKFMEGCYADDEERNPKRHAYCKTAAFAKKAFDEYAVELELPLVGTVWYVEAQTRREYDAIKDFLDTMIYDDSDPYIVDVFSGATPNKYPAKCLISIEPSQWAGEDVYCMRTIDETLVHKWQVLFDLMKGANG